MKRRTILRGVLIAGAGRLMAATGPGEFTLRSDVRLVLLDVSVKNREGAPVPGLSKDNFVVFEDGKPETVTVFSKSDMPVTVGLLVDESESMRNKRADVVLAGDAFITESNPQDEMFVLNFNDTVRRGLPERVRFSGNPDLLHRALERGAPHGKTALNDAIVEGIDQLKDGTRERKALVIISDGGDNASKHSAKEVHGLIESHLATIYAVGIYDVDAHEKNPGFLRRIVHESGGEAWFPQEPSNVIAACTGIAHDIRSRYTIGYTPPAIASGPGNRNGLRRISVRLTGMGKTDLTVRTRTSYRYDQP